MAKLGELLVMKTKASLFEALSKFIESKHEYQVPEIFLIFTPREPMPFPFGPQPGGIIATVLP
jgi:hypothetical protein